MKENFGELPCNICILPCNIALIWGKCNILVSLKDLFRGWPHGRVVKFVRSTVGGPVFRWFQSGVQTWRCSSSHAEAASHVPQLEGPTTENIQLCPGGLWGETEKKI